MPGQVCAVAACKSNRFTLKKKGVHIIFHSFPKASDLVSSKIRKEWIDRCKRGDKFNPNTSTVCCLHFTPNDYERDLQNELLGLPLRRVLKKTAVPTLNMRGTNATLSETVIEDTSRAKRAEKRNKILVESLLEKTSLDSGKFGGESSRLLDAPSTSTIPPTSYIEITDKPSTSSISEDTYKQKYEDILLKYNRLKANSDKKIKTLNNMLNYYKVKCHTQSIKRSTAKLVIAEKLLNIVLTKNQINLLSRKRKSCSLDS